jgi:ABC-type microcin C transport system duplicated ATPase subunit YejF
MAVLISHRFSTVRMADRILVLKNGELGEQGTHEALLALGGLYPELFQLQAAGYRATKLLGTPCSARVVSRVPGVSFGASAGDNVS